MAEQSFYDILGVKVDATLDDIKKAYRDLARIHHPDKAGNTPEVHERFVKIQAAYETLSDDEKRRAYDRRYGFSAGAPNIRDWKASRGFAHQCDPATCDTCGRFSEQAELIYDALYRRWKGERVTVPPSSALPKEFLGFLTVKFLQMGIDQYRRADILDRSMVYHEWRIAPLLLREAVPVRERLARVRQKLSRLGGSLDRFLERGFALRGPMELKDCFEVSGLLGDLSSELHIMRELDLRMHSIVTSMSQAPHNREERARFARQFTDALDECLRKSRI